MPECSFHPGVETELRCGECGRYICPKEMVETPVGYKCPICAKQPRSAVVHVKPRQLAGGAGLALLVGAGGAALLGLFGGGLFGFFSLILGFAWGGAVAEAAHRGSGGHRGGAITAISIGSVLFGALFSWFVLGAFGLHTIGLFAVVAGVLGAAGDSAAWWSRRG